MPETIAILGASGKIGNATLSALLAHGLAPASSIIALTSTRPGSEKWAALAATGAQVRHAAFEDPASLEAALRGASTFFLVSTPDIALDFCDEDGNALGPGRASHHRGAVDAAARAGVRRLVYSSLAFAFDGAAGAGKHESKAAVMQAHLRTEAYLRQLVAEKAGRGRLAEVVAVREGLYAESWPLYLGYFSAGGDDDRTTVKLAGDGKACWTAIPDLGVANALVLAAPPGTYDGYRMFYLSTSPVRHARSLSEIAALVAQARGKEVKVEVVGSKEHVRHYVEDRGLQGPAVRWWVGTYDALEDGECVVEDPTLEELLSKVGLKPTPVEDIVRAMVKGSS